MKDKENYKNKIDIYNSIIKYIKSKIDKEYNLIIIFDSHFIYKFNESIELEVFEQTNNSFTFFKSFDKSFTIKLFFMKTFPIEYLFEIMSIDNDHEWQSKVDYYINIISNI